VWHGARIGSDELKAGRAGLQKTFSDNTHFSLLGTTFYIIGRV
jgi:hypothetical protein